MNTIATEILASRWGITFVTHPFTTTNAFWMYLRLIQLTYRTVFAIFNTWIFVADKGLVQIKNSKNKEGISLHFLQEPLANKSNKNLYLAIRSRKLGGAIAICFIFDNMTSATVVTEKSIAIICVWS